MRSKLLILLFINLSLPSFSQNAILSDKAKISIFTCGKGEELYTTFGHTAIRIKDDATQLDVVFNYGQFDFREGNFYVKFVKGNLQYSIGVTSFDDFIFEYQQENRKVVEQTLRLTQNQKQQLFDALLSAQFSPDESHYTYKFIDRNCTTMVVEKINALLPKPLIAKVDDKTISYREVLYPKFKNYFWYKLGINIIFGTKVDQKSEKLFLPNELLNSLDKLTINGLSIVEKKEVIVLDQQPKIEFQFFNSVYFVSLLLLILFFINKPFLTNSYFIVAGLLGSFMCLVGFYSLHEELLWNYNALLFNPLLLILPFIKNQNLKKKLLILCAVLLAFYVVLMLSKPHLLLMLPIIVCHLSTYLRMLALSKKA